MRTAYQLSRIDSTLKAALLLAILIGLLYLTLEVFLMIFAGVLLAVMLGGMAEFVQRWTRLPYGAALAFVILGVLLLFAVAGLLMAPSLSGQVDQIGRDLPEGYRKIKDVLGQYSWGQYLVEKAPQQAEEVKQGMEGRVTSLASSLIGALGTFVVILFLGIYLAVDPKVYRTGLLRLFPREKRARVKEILEEVEKTLRKWLLGTATAMLIVGCLTGTGLMIVGVPLSLLFGVLACILDFVPNVGPIIAALPAVLLTLSMDPGKILSVLAVYACVQAIEGYLVTPLVQQRAVDLPPALTILAQVFMGYIAGALGVALATPLAAAGMVVVRMVYVEDELGDRKSGQEA